MASDPADKGGPEGRDERLGRLMEAVAALLERGGELDAGALAERFSLSTDEVSRCVAAARALVAGGPTRSGTDTPELPAAYELREEIGRGGMGVVWRAHHAGLGRDVAVKVLRAENTASREAVVRFRREAEGLRELAHPNVVPILEVGETGGGGVFLAMELIEGASLARLIADGELTPSRSVKLCRQVAAAIAATHARGWIHRDLKPGNVLVDSSDDAYVVDFGLARAVAVRGEATSTGNVVGTPDYMSPEQARGDTDAVGEASDVYSLGALLYACLTSHAPFEELPIAEKMHALVHDEPTPPRRFVPQLPRELEAICLRGMEKDPADRYPTARAFEEDLAAWAEGRPVVARRPGVLRRARRAARRKRASLAVAGALTLTAGMALFSLLADDGPTARARLADGDALLARGELRAAAQLYRDGLARLEAPDSRAGRELRLALARAELGIARRARDDDRPSERAAAAQRATGLLNELGSSSDSTLAEHGTSRWQLSFERGAAALLADEPAAAQRSLRGALARAGSGGQREELLERAARALLDPASYAHDAGANLLAIGWEWERYGAVGEWLHTREDGVALLAAFVRAWPALVDEPRAAALQGLLEAGALHDHDLRVASLDPLLDALLLIAEDPLAPESSRALAADLVAVVHDLPLRMPADLDGPVHDGPIASRIAAASRKLRARGDTLAARVLLANGCLRDGEEVEESARAWLTPVFGAERVASLSARRTIDFDLETLVEVFPELDSVSTQFEQMVVRLLETAGRERRALHTLLLMIGPKDPGVPYWPTWGSVDEPPDLAARWQSFAAGWVVDPVWRERLTSPTWHLRLAKFVWNDGDSQPLLAWERVVDARRGETVDVRLTTPATFYPGVRGRAGRPRLGNLKMGLLPESARGEAGVHSFEMRGELRLVPGGARLDFVHLEHDYSTAGRYDWMSVSPIGRSVSSRRVRPVAIREYGFPQHRAHASFQLTLAYLDFGAATAESWGIEAWRARLADGLAEDAQQLALTTGDWAASFDEHARASMANQWLAACYLPLPSLGAELGNVHQSIVSSGRMPEFYWGDTGAGELDEGVRKERRRARLSDGFRDTGGYLTGARLAAGDVRAAGLVSERGVLESSDLGYTYWARLWCETSVTRVADLALEQLASKFTPEPFWPRLARVAAENGEPLPPWAEERVAQAPAALAALTRRTSWKSAVQLLYIALIIICATLAVLPRIDRDARLVLAGGSLFLAFIADLRAFEGFGLFFPVDPIAFSASAVAAHVLARRTTERRPWATIGFAVAAIASAIEAWTPTASLFGVGAASPSLSVASTARLAGLALAFLSLPSLARSLAAPLPKPSWHSHPWIRQSMLGVFLPIVTWRIVTDLLTLTATPGAAELEQVVLTPFRALVDGDDTRAQRLVAVMAYVPAWAALLAVYAVSMLRAQQGFEDRAAAGSGPHARASAGTATPPGVLPRNS